MDPQIRQLEKEAYYTVLRAFQAQADELSWEKEKLMADLRLELRAPDDEHRELLHRVRDDDLIRQIREWRQTRGRQAVGSSNPINAVSVRRPPRKSRSMQYLLAHTLPVTASSVQPSPSATALGSQGRKTQQSQSSKQGSAGVESVISGSGAQLLGRRVRTKRLGGPFREAVITQYNPFNGEHALVYDINTPKQRLQWINLIQIPPEAIQWVDGGPGFHHGGPSDAGPSQGAERNLQRNEPHNEREDNKIVIRNTDKLLKEVQRIVDGSNPDPDEVKKAKEVLKEHEQSLVDAISKIDRFEDRDST